MVKTPLIWMEARCCSVAGTVSQNWRTPVNCFETADGGFFDSVAEARKHFQRHGWRIIDGEWWCPVCARIIKGSTDAKRT